MHKETPAKSFLTLQSRDTGDLTLALVPWLFS